MIQILILYFHNLALNNEFWKRKYIVFITAFTETNLVQEALNLQINKFITKPIIDFELFLESIENIAQELTHKKSIDQENTQFLEKNKILDEHVVSCTLDLDGNIIEMSNAFLKVTKYDKEEILNKNNQKPFVAKFYYPKKCYSKS